MANFSFSKVIGLGLKVTKLFSQYWGNEDGHSVTGLQVFDMLEDSVHWAYVGEPDGY